MGTDSSRYAAPIPANEEERLAALHSYRILDTEAERLYDELTALTAYITDKPWALITLVERDRQWFKSRYGTEIDETPRDVSFCARTMLHDRLIVVPDATQDPRFNENPYVTGEPGIRFYAGAPLITPDGYGLGSLCVVDTVPGELDASQQDALTILARQVMALFEYRKTAARLAGALEQVRTLSDLMVICSYCRKVRAESKDWQELESVVVDTTDTRFSHGVCPACAEEVVKSLGGENGPPLLG